MSRICAAITIPIIFIPIAITEAYILHISLTAKDSCSPFVWWNILTCCIIHFMTGLNAICNNVICDSALIIEHLNHVLKCDNYRHNKNHGIIVISNVAVYIWSNICLFDKSDCMSQYVELWNLVILEVTLFYISIVIFIILLTIAICTIRDDDSIYLN